MNHAQTDYLVIGSGAAGLAFADTLITERPEAHVTLVDRHGKPGGHWNDAYAFVTLHQPSAFYGVNSLELGSGRIDTVGANAGMAELASGPEVSGYFDRVMKHRLLPSGRVSYHPLCNYLGDGTFESLLSGKRTQVAVRRKVVDATYFSPSVPATHAPRFAVAAGVRLVPPGALPGLWHRPLAGDPPRRFVVIGAGKTAMDTCVWLIEAGTDPGAITWVVPRDSWLVNRITTQNAPQFFHQAIGSQADQMEAFARATSADDLFLRLESFGAVLRIHPDRMPTMFHLATMTPAEVAVLRGIADVVRLGRVLAIDADGMRLDGGRVATEPGSLFIDCTASAVEPRPVQPIFQGERIVLQMVRLPQPTFSAALTAYVEAHYAEEADKNRLCGSVPFPHAPADYPRSMMQTMLNQMQWSQDEALRQWVRASRLDGFGKLIASADRSDPAQQAILARYKEQAGAAVANMTRLLAEPAA